MKNLILLCMIFFGSTAFACTDFSGNYRDEYGSHFSLSQEGCSNIRYTEDNDTLDMPTNGKEFLWAEFNATIEGKPANVKFYSTLMFEAEILIRNDRNVITYSDEVTEVEKILVTISLNSTGDIVSVSHYEDGSTDTSIDRKIR